MQLYTDDETEAHLNKPWLDLATIREVAVFSNFFEKNRLLNNSIFTSAIIFWHYSAPAYMFCTDV